MLDCIVHFPGLHQGDGADEHRFDDAVFCVLGLSLAGKQEKQGGQYQKGFPHTMHCVQK